MPQIEVNQEDGSIAVSWSGKALTLREVQSSGCLGILIEFEAGNFVTETVEVGENGVAVISSESAFGGNLSQFFLN